MSETLPCVVCGRRLENIQGPGQGNQPNDGLEFVTQGAYGTTVFDPMDGSYLALNICDPCVKGAIEQGKTREYPPAAPGSEKAHLLDRIAELETMLGSKIVEASPGI